MKLRLYIIFTLILAGSISYASAIIEKPQQYTDRRRSNIVMSNVSARNSAEDLQTLNTAIKELQSKIKTSPNNYLLNISLADLYLKTNQYDKAFQEFVYINNLNNQNKLNAEMKKEIGDIYAKTQYNLLYSKDKANLHLNMAIMSLILNQDDKAEKHIKSLIASDSNNKYLVEALKKVYDDTQNYSEAVNSCNKILTYHPNNTQVRKLKALYLLQSGLKDDAIEEYTIIAASGDNDIDSKYELYKLLLNKNMNDKDILKKMYSSESTETALSDLANVLVQKKDLNNAEKYADILVKKYPDNAQGYVVLAEIYRNEGKIQEAYDLLTKIRDKADNNEVIAQYNVLLAKLSDEPLQEANSLMANGLYEQALSVLQSASQENLYVILAQARAYYFAEQKQKSLEYLNKAMSLYPNNSDVLCAFGYIYLQEKELDSAYKYVNDALKISPDNKTAQDLLKLVQKAQAGQYINRIIASFDAQNLDETMRLINEALTISPDYSILYYYKGLTYIAQANYAASTGALYKCLELDKSNINAYFYLATAFDNLSEHSTALNYYEKFLELSKYQGLGESEKVKYAQNRISKLKL